MVEVLVSIFLLGTCLLVITFAFSAGMEYIMMIKERSIATQSAQECIELIRDMPFSDILTVSSDFTSPGMNSLDSATGTITVDNPNGTDDMRRVTITIDWTSIRGTAESKTLVTFVTRGGINKQ